MSDLSDLSTRYGVLSVLRSDSVIGRSLGLYGEWAEHEISVLSSFIEPGTTFIDVGANIGTHSVAIARRVPSAVVISIEGQPLAFSLLQCNLLRNELWNVYAKNVIVGDKVGTAISDINYAEVSNVGAVSYLSSDVHSHIPEFSYTGIPIQCMMLDQFKFPGRVSLIKIDAEGMEARVIAGARNIISEHRPVLSVEILNIEDLEVLFTLFAELNYKLFWLETHAFNCSNFNKCDTNIWARTEMALLSVPVEACAAIALPPVTGEETSIPFHLNAFRGWSGEVL